MSMRSLGAELEQERQKLPERIYEHVQQHGIDPDGDDVADLVKELFGQTVAEDFVEFISC